MRTTIKVTREDIANGKKGEIRACPIALSVQRATGMKYGVATHGIIAPEGTRTVDELPNRARKFVKDFDAGLPVEPIVFYVEL